MQTVEKIRQAFERNAKALSLRPSIGQGTAVARVRVTDGFTCQVEDGPWKLTVDLAEKSGGNNQGPNPGVLGRAALGSCLAVTYVMWAAKLGVPIDALQVDVQADYDARGYHGVAEVKPGYGEIRYVVQVKSPASEREVLQMLDAADAHCDYLAVFAEPQKVRREVQISSGG